MTSKKKIRKRRRFGSDSIWANIRKDLDLTQVEMAETIGCTQPWLWQVEKERSLPSILFVMRFCREFNVDIRKIERYYRERESHFTGALSR